MKIVFKLFLLFATVFASSKIFAQVSINTTGAAANSNAMLDVSSNTKGVLLPRMSSANRNAINNPKTGLMVFDTTTASFWYSQTHLWRELSTGSSNSDSLLTFGQTSGTVNSFNISNGATYTNLSGYLYDSGGPAGNYGNNEDITATIQPAGSGYVGLRLQILSADMDVFDGIYISDAVNTYRYSGNTTDVIYLPPGGITIHFVSDNNVAYTGFQMRWDVIKAPTPVTANPPLTGWFYNPQKFSEAGGVNLDNYWSADSTGLYSLSYGGANKSSGKYAVALGNYNIASGDNSVALGYGSVAGGQYSMAANYYTTAPGQGSFASGISSQASGISSFAANFGSRSPGFGSASFNENTAALSEASSAFGLSTVTKGYAGTTLGAFNDSILTTTQTSLATNTPLLTVGNGDNNTTRSNALVVLKNGNTAIGNILPQQNLSVAAGMNIDQSSANNGTITNTLTFGGGSGEGIGSKRTAGGNTNGLDFYAANAVRMSINNAGNVGIGVTVAAQKLEVNGNAAIDGNLTVGASNFGIIRNSGAAQMKIVNTTVTVNPAGGIGAGATINMPVTFSQTFSSAPLVYIGSCNGSGGWAEAVMTTTASGNTGCTLWVFNPRGITVNPNFTVSIIAIGTP